ncbi:hypothetical protein, partial [Providencia rettgeri]
DKNKKLTNKSEELKNEIDDLKSAIRYESKIRGIAYLKKESKYLVSLEKEIPMENNIEGKNKKNRKIN